MSASIMAHPVRRREAEELQAALDREVPIVFDEIDEPSADPGQRWAVGERCWRAHDPDADWHMVIQDDAVPCEDLIAGLETALDQLGPDGLMCAFTGRGKPRQTHVRRAIRHAEDKGHAWMSTRSLCWGVAILAPVATIDDMLDWCNHPDRSATNYDKRIGEYYRDELGWRTWYPVPSLVDHRDVRSLVGHDGDGRGAYRLLDTSALDVDWSRTPPAGLTAE